MLSRTVFAGCLDSLGRAYVPTTTYVPGCGTLKVIVRVPPAPTSGDVDGLGRVNSLLTSETPRGMAKCHWYPVVGLSGSMM